MASGSSGVGSKPTAVTNFDRASADLLQSSEALKAKAENKIKEAGDELVSAGSNAQQAAAHLLGATVNAGMAVGYTVKGTVWDAGVKGVGHGAVGTVAGAGGTAALVTEEGLGVGARIANAFGRGMVWVSNSLNELVGNGKSATVIEVEGKGDRLSSRLFGVAGEQFEMSGKGFKEAWASYGQAVGHALGAGVNVGYVAAYVGLSSYDLAQAAVKTGHAGFIKAAQYTNVLSAAAVQAAENGMEGAADLAALAAKAGAGLGDLMATPSAGNTIDIQLNKNQAVHDASLRELLNKNPALKDLPAFKQLQTAPAK